jgi:hypothetical protein
MATTKDLMRQKVNVNEVLLNHWDKNMAFNLRNLINKWLIKYEDKGKSFEYQGRTFTLIGMTENEHCMVTETIDGVTVYWETSTYFVQMNFGLFYFEWVKLPNGLTTTQTKNYEMHKLYLPAHKASRKKKVEEEEIIEEDEMVMETYVDDAYNETDNDE